MMWASNEYVAQEITVRESNLLHIKCLEGVLVGFVVLYVSDERHHLLSAWML